MRINCMCKCHPNAKAKMYLILFYRNFNNNFKILISWYIFRCLKSSSLIMCYLFCCYIVFLGSLYPRISSSTISNAPAGTAWGCGLNATPCQWGFPHAHLKASEQCGAGGRESSGQGNMLWTSNRTATFLPDHLFIWSPSLSPILTASKTRTPNLHTSFSRWVDLETDYSRPVWKSEI